SVTAISLGRALPRTSSGLPGDSAGSVVVSCLTLLRTRFTVRRLSPGARCALTAPFHPYPREAGGLLSVALARGLPRVGVTHRPALWSPDVPRRRRRTDRRRDRLAGPFINRPVYPLGAPYASSA